MSVTYLLDTHVLLWWLDRPALLSEAARREISDGRNTMYVSAAAVWEIAIKKALGKLRAPDNLEEAMAENRFLPLPVTVGHALGVLKLPLHHRDPFDRMLIAQALQEGFTLISRDAHVARYGVPHVKA